MVDFWCLLFPSQNAWAPRVKGESASSPYHTVGTLEEFLLSVSVTLASLRDPSAQGRNAENEAAVLAGSLILITREKLGCCYTGKAENYVWSPEDSLETS